MEEIQEVNLHVDGQVFPVKKDILCKHSDYFRAMFSGNYIEKARRDITIDVADANSMNLILRYIDFRTINLPECTLPEICNLAMTANFLQITEIMKIVENHFDDLDLEPTVSNCMEIMETAEHCSYTKLEHICAAFGLVSFKSMKPEYISTIERLFWYLSHPYLATDNEIDVFQFGLDWISQMATGGDALLIVLGCLDVKRLTTDNLKQMSSLIKDNNNSLAKKVINCLEWLRNSGDISLEAVVRNRLILYETFTESVYTETYNIVKESKERKLKYTSVVQSKCIMNFLFTYTAEKSVNPWLDLPQKLDGWSIAAWGSTKIVLVCGQYRERRSFMKDVVIYDTVRKEWRHQGVSLPPRSHAGVAVLNDLLFIVGGQACRNHVQRFNPENDSSWERISMGRITTTLWNFRTHIIAYLGDPSLTDTEPESFSEDNDVRLVHDIKVDYKVFVGSYHCLVVLDVPSSLRMEPSKYHQKYLSKYYI